MRFDYVKLVRDDIPEGMGCEVYLEEWREADHGDKERLGTPGTLGASSHSPSWCSMSTEHVFHLYPYILKL